MAEARAAQRTIAGDGVSLALHEWGDPADRTVVLVHGFPDTHAVWILVAESLVDHGFHVVAHDVRGAGASEAPLATADYRMERLVGDLAAVIDVASPDRAVHLVGHDWGSIQSWAAVADPRLAGRVASFTSISGPSLDYTGRWLRARLRGRAFLTLLRQSARSAYVAVIHLPGLPRGTHALGRAVGRGWRSAWARTLRRMDGARTDDAWPAPTFGTDVANGMHLYRANFRPHLLRPDPVPVDVPVLLVIPTKDRFVPEWLFEGIEELVPALRRRHVTATHWVIRSQPVDIASWIADLAAEVEGQRSFEEARP